MYSVVRLFTIWSDIFTEQKDYLTELDSVAGDADLGIVMNDGFASTAEFVATSEVKDVGMLFFQAGKYFNKVASSSMGTLLSSGFMTVGKKLKGKTELTDEDIPVIAEGIAEGVQSIGKAKEGEKTFLDSMFPAVRVLKSDKELKNRVTEAVAAAEEGVNRAKDLVGKHGRIAFRGSDSVGIIDPGTVVALFLVKGLQKLVEE